MDNTQTRTLIKETNFKSYKLKSEMWKFLKINTLKVTWTVTKLVKIELENISKLCFRKHLKQNWIVTRKINIWKLNLTKLGNVSKLKCIENNSTLEDISKSTFLKLNCSKYGNISNLETFQIYKCFKSWKRLKTLKLKSTKLKRFKTKIYKTWKCLKTVALVHFEL